MKGANLSEHRPDPCVDRPNPSEYRQCIRDRLRTEIVRRILDGRYPPDMHLKEMALAKEFGTSQAPVREALRELEALGLVESQRYRGTRVLNFQSVDSCEAYELRALIEERSAQLAVPCQPHDIATFTDLVQTMCDASTVKDAERYIAAALIFHRRIVELSGNSQFLKTYDAMQWEVRSRIAAYREICGLYAHASDHAEVTQFLAKGDGSAAGSKLRSMLEGVAAALHAVTQSPEPAPRQEPAQSA